MPLPVIPSRHEPSREDLLRLFHQAQGRWCQNLAQEQALDVGTAYSNPRLGAVCEANSIRDAALPEGMSARDAYELVERHYAAANARCACWTMNPSAVRARTDPLVEHLRSLGYRERRADLLLLRQSGRPANSDPGDVRVIPARASFRHARIILEELAALRNQPQLAEAAMCQLDDPHWEPLLAMRRGRPIAYGGVLSVGQVGRIDQVFVSADHRRQGIGQLMMARILDICARSLFRHVMLAVPPDQAAAQAFCCKMGFQAVGQLVSYRRPGLEED